MAYAAPIVTSTKETTNYARLCRLLVDVGSQALRDTFDKIHPPANLHTVLSANIAILKDLRAKRVINPIQWGTLFPPIPSTVSSRDFDITLLMVLLRNLCGLVPPLFGWNALPDETDESLEADISRIKHFRNSVYAHAEKASVDDVTFSDYWRDIRDTLVRLGGNTYAAAVDSLKNESMDPEVQDHYKRLLSQWKRDEDNIKEQLNEIMKKLDVLVTSKEIAGEKEKYTATTHRVPTPTMCKERYHENEAVQYYCVECEGCICSRCGKTRHNRHQKVDIHQVAEDKKVQMRRVINKAKTQVIVAGAKAKEQARLMKESKQQMVDAQKNLKDSVETFIQRLREHESAMKMKLNDIYEAQQREHTKRLEDFNLHISKLRASIEHDEDILRHGSGLEVLESDGSTFSLQEEAMNNQQMEMEIYRPRHINYISNQGTWEVSKPGQIVVSHTDPSTSTAEGRGLTEASINLETMFTVTTRDSEGNLYYGEGDRVTVTICSPTGQDRSEDLESVEDCKDGNYTVRYTLKRFGLHYVRIGVNGRTLTGSPWSVLVTPHRYKVAFQSRGVSPSVFVFPWSVAVNERTGQIAVAGYSNKTIQLFNKQWKPIKKIGGSGNRAPLNIGHPLSVAFLRKDDMLFTCEEIAHEEQMSVFTVQGQFISRFSDHLIRPLSVCVKCEGDGHVIVSDVGDRRIKVLSPDGRNLLQCFSPPDCQETAEFICYHSGMFFASYQREHCVKVFSDEGEFLYDVGCYGSRNGEFINPVGVAVDSFNQLIVCDTGNRRAQVLTLKGNALYSIPEEIIENPWFVTVSSNADLLITDVTVAKHCIHVLN